MTLEDLRKIGHVKLVTQKNSKHIQGKIIYTRLGPFNKDEVNSRIDILWHVSCHFPKPRPLWSGCMQLLHSQLPHPGKSSAMFLPVVDLTPSDPTCVRSTLECIAEHARCHQVSPVITFDQQLWWIAFMIIQSQPDDSLLPTDCAHAGRVSH